MELYTDKTHAWKELIYLVFLNGTIIKQPSNYLHLQICAAANIHQRNFMWW